MQRPAMKCTMRAAVALLAIALLAALSSSAVASAAKPTTLVREAENEELGRTVLTNMSGHTLYSLSAETHGKFICTGPCLSAWHPLLVAPADKPTGPVHLGTIKRPEGKTQVTYRGRPLYRFTGDTKAGDANGEGLKDVGTWHAAGPGATSSAPTETPAYPISEPNPAYPPVTPPVTPPVVPPVQPPSYPPGY